MVGRKLTEGLVKTGSSAANRLRSPIRLVDVVAAGQPERVAAAVRRSFPRRSFRAGRGASLVATRPDLIVHLAAIVSGEAEADFEKGYRINLDGDAGPARGHPARRAAAALYAAPGVLLVDCRLRCAVPGGHRRRVLLRRRRRATARRRHRRIAALRLSRHGFFDGIGIRLPTIFVRPGKPNGRVRLLLQYPARTACGAGGRAAGRGDRPPLVFAPEGGGRFPGTCGRPSTSRSLGAAASRHARPFGHRRRGDRGPAARCR